MLYWMSDLHRNCCRTQQCVLKKKETFLKTNCIACITEQLLALEKIFLDFCIELCIDLVNKQSQRDLKRLQLSYGNWKQNLTVSPCITGGTQCHIWLRHCATSRKIAGSIPFGVTGIIHWHYHSVRPMALRLTQLLTEMSTRNISWGELKDAGA